MAQWSPFVSAEKPPPLPAGIPEEWQKAQAALKAVQPVKTTSLETSPAQSPATTMNGYSSMNWAHQPMYYPGYGYPNYGYYNMNYNYPFYMTSPTTQPAPMPSMVSMPSSVPNRESHLQSTSVLPSSPSPSLPTTPVVEKDTFKKEPSFSGIATQSPGSGNIKFNLPKKNPNFNAHRDALNERMNNFKKSEVFPVEEIKKEEKSEDSKVDLIKNVNAMDASTWPPSVQKYVNESFQKCKNDIDRNQVETILKGKLMRAYAEGTIFTKDWSKEPLPSILSDRIGPIQPKLSNFNQDQSKPFSQSRNSYQNKKEGFHSRSRSRSRSCSRSPKSPTSSRKVIHRKRYSSSSPDSNEDVKNLKKSISSRIVGSSEMHTPKNNFKKKQKGKQNKKKNKKPFAMDSDLGTDDRLQKRAARFEAKGNKNYSTPKSNSFSFTPNNSFIVDEIGADIEWGNDAVVGTCQDLEKPFLRLTGAIDPSGVRPEEILKKSLSMVKDAWKQKQDYHFVCEQLKSIRQDLVVQCIRNDFAVQVYETHARIALEKGDHTEFNQCQSQLKALYQEVKTGNRLEFTGYHILYTMYTENIIDLKHILTDLKSDDKSDEVVSHALKLSKAWSNNNYCRFFSLYLSAPKMSNYIIDWFIERIRKAALKAIIKSFRPSLPVSYIESALAFSSSEECLAFLTEANLVFSGDGVINCKDSVGPIATF